MSRRYICDICGSESGTPATFLSGYPSISGALSGRKVGVRISVMPPEANDYLDLCRECFNTAVLRVIGETPQ